VKASARGEHLVTHELQVGELMMASTNCFRAVRVALISGLAVASLRAEIIEAILVKVNGEIFTKTDLERRQVAVLRGKGQHIDLKSDPTNQQLRGLLNDIPRGWWWMRWTRC
jgi:hypothetical protein